MFKKDIHSSQNIKKCKFDCKYNRYIIKDIYKYKKGQVLCMTADNLKILGNSTSMWKTKLNSARNTDVAGNIPATRSSSSRRDTFEITGVDKASVDSTSTGISVSDDVKSEKSNIVRELSESHTDVNRFLEIKAQVRAGEYNLDAKEIADSLMPYMDYDILA